MFHSEAHIFCLYLHVNKVSLVSLLPLGLNREELPHSDAEIRRSGSAVNFPLPLPSSPSSKVGNLKPYHSGPQGTQSTILQRILWKELYRSVSTLGQKQEENVSDSGKLGKISQRMWYLSNA